MDNGQWTMDDGRWTMTVGTRDNTRSIIRLSSIVYRPSSEAWRREWRDARCKDSRPPPPGRAAGDGAGGAGGSMDAVVGHVAGVVQLIRLVNIVTVVHLNQAVEIAEGRSHLRIVR